MKYFDVSKTVKEKGPGFLQKMPVFVLKLIERIICQEKMNNILTKYANIEKLEFLNAMIDEFKIKIEIEGHENLPENGRCFFFSNHPFGIIDGLILTKIISDKYGEIKAIGNEMFLLIPQLRPFIAAVNVFGKNPKEYVAALDQIYESNIPITHFPAGEVSRLYEKKVQDCKWQKSFITKAVSTKRDVVPIFFHGRNSNLFYSIYLIRKFFGIKTNIELMLLPREMFRKQRKTIKVKIGKPIPWDTFNNKTPHVEWAQRLKEHVYRTGKNKESNIEI